MINAAALLKDLKPLLRRLEDDIRERCSQVATIRTELETEHSKASTAGRTAQTLQIWIDDLVTQAAVSWILACVYVRFIEDNRLIDEAWIAGPGLRLEEARDRYTAYFRKHPRETDRDYLLQIFSELANLPAVNELLADLHNPLHRLAPSGDGARLLLDFFQKRSDATGDLIHDFIDESRETRFLGDLYQDLSESARKKYALLQTPDFVEEFILDYTLTPAIETFGLKEVRLIDPTCGSGHFLLGAFHRILKLWQEQEPETNIRELVNRALNAVHGVDINPYAVAIARFRLLVAALQSCEIDKLQSSPAFTFNLVVGDSLLHGPRPGDKGARNMYFEEVDAGFDGVDPIGFVYKTENAGELRRILGKQYHAVVGNPPYITVKDKALSKAYRERFRSCHRQYSLVCPFTERFFDLTVAGSETEEAGYVGMIAANSFMKREFGKKLIESFIPRWDLTHVIDTSGAYIPGHGTPTVIFFGRHQKPVNEKVRIVMGIKGEPGAPTNPEQGEVWSSIVELFEQSGMENDFISVVDIPRGRLEKHPWNLGGGGVSELKEFIQQNCKLILSDVIDTICLLILTRCDEVYLVTNEVLNRNKISKQFQKKLGIGENIRDWKIRTSKILFPYDEKLAPVNEHEGQKVHQMLWPHKEYLWRRRELGGDHRQLKRTWWEWNRFLKHRFKCPFAITFAFVATHNHFILDRSGKIFKQSAPVIKLHADTAEIDYLKLLGLLNSSSALFWARQTLFPKGGYSEGKWQERLEWDGTKLKQFPIPSQSPIDLAAILDSASQKIIERIPDSLIQKQLHTREILMQAQFEFTEIREQMIALQEELDWQCYHFYQITKEKLWLLKHNDVPRIKLGERAFEIVMARRMQTDEFETTWFERHGSTPITEIPSYWPEEYRNLVEKRIKLIESDKNIGLIERPEYKRRWAMESWDKQVKAALEQWLLNRLEFVLSGRDLMAEDATQPATKEPELISCAQLADMLRADSEFLQVAELYMERDDFAITRLAQSLVEKESVPLLPVFRYKAGGLRKRKDWEHTWELQRQEDAIDARTDLDEAEIAALKKKEVGEIPVPPKYQSKDFLKASFWKLRGKLDVPKERFISFPGCERDGDETLVITWAGWDHLEQARAIAAYLERAKESGWSVERKMNLLACLWELLPWLKQWHNDLNPDYGVGMGDFFAEYIETATRELGKTTTDLDNFTPANGK